MGMVNELKIKHMQRYAHWRYGIEGRTTQGRLLAVFSPSLEHNFIFHTFYIRSTRILLLLLIITTTGADNNSIDNDAIIHN